MVSWITAVIACPHLRRLQAALFFGVYIHGGVFTSLRGISIAVRKDGPRATAPI